ncbi:MAG: hypothetical protein J1F22_04320 [Lachnospiraceae bacterium]|nr:hypothetical protein [Lachnospiraceae bacterium]
MAFQILGILLALLLFKKEKLCLTLLFGSTIGSFSLQWLPVLYAFFFQFSVRAHIFALFTMIVLVSAFYYLSKERSFLNGRKIKPDLLGVFRENPVLFLLLPLFVYVVIVLLHHTISYRNGILYSGQGTWGDMSMHLGFVTSIAKQKAFPPEYSILPGTKLAYPFLSDSISSSIYIWGTSLRIAYLLPMFFAFFQVFFGMYTLAKYLLQKMGTVFRGKAFLAFALFFFNGGLGFYYFINKGFFNENFTRIFTAFYQTPTNYTDANIQWHNIICDMLIPQRATLFGWAILFPILVLLMKAISGKERNYFIIAGVMAGGLPLIHTHSFLALGVLCAGFLTLDLYHRGQKGDENKRFPWPVRLIIVLVFLFSMTIISIKQFSDNPLEEDIFLYIGIFMIAIFAGIFAYQLKKGFSKEILLTWGIFLGIVLILALPQLFGFTFRQAQGDNFVRGMFNWANGGDVADGYPIFYLKNLGILFPLALLMLIFGTKRQIQLVLPATFLWLICEFIVFQPNPYDNNKLLLVSYLFFCIAISDFVWEMAGMLFTKMKWMRGITISLIAAVSVFAAVLTMGREYVSELELFDSTYAALAEWVEENTEPTDTFLTADNHNNAIAALTGRNIVCGSGSYLYYHGINYGQNEFDVEIMYEDPSQRELLLEHYNVDYIVIGSNERNTYLIDLDTILKDYSIVYENNDLVVLAV